MCTSLITRHIIATYHHCESDDDEENANDEGTLIVNAKGSYCELFYCRRNMINNPISKRNDGTIQT
ncbi:hypothetical protein GALL_536430 [mine drainage metagenome]|uniref:Uncharacterized protein n=1 Tax=mine drainage metagenome TaxID=410659 RepID=A0A1J5PMK3_9ZZZZ